MNRPRLNVAWLVSLGCLLGAARASAQIDLGAFGRAVARASSSGSTTPSVFARGSAGKVPVIVRSRSGVISAPELTSMGGFAFAQLDAGRMAELAQAHPDWSFDWSP